jgi:HPt (histidine-containing phosphotransfer) domain-containing protein
VGNTPEPAIADAMNRLWVRFLPQIEARVTTLEEAATALRAGALTGDLKEKACADAHKLAGVLGTFGLHEGTGLAREAEEAYRGDPEAGRKQVDHLAGIASQLRALLASRE